MGEYIRKPNIKCFVCGKSVYRRPIQIKQSDGRAFCSQVCYGIYCRKEKPCIICGKPILAGLHKKTCSRECSNKNRAGIKYGAGRPNDKAKQYRNLKTILFEERGKKCERCGFNKFEILEIHHKDRDRRHNTLRNLELICPNCHAEEHYSKNGLLRKGGK